MLLIGQYDSPFTRRVGIALTLYGIAFEHRPWSTFGDKEKVAAFNPLMRVPTLVLGDGDVLIESHVIIDYVDSLVPADKRLYPQTEPERHRAMHVAALATGLSDKCVSLFYETVLHRDVSELWVARCREQIDGTLAMLEKDRAGRTSPLWFGEAVGHADIAVAASLRHMSEAHAGTIDLGAYPALKAHSDQLEALPVFQEISQRFIPPA